MTEKERLEKEIDDIRNANKADTQYQLFRGKNLKDTDFSGQNLIGCNFREANLRGCNFTGALLHYANFKDADITGAIFDENTKVSMSAWLVAGETDHRVSGHPVSLSKVDKTTLAPGEDEIRKKYEELMKL